MNKVLYEKNAEAAVPMASTTKIMTALIALQTGNLDQIVTIGQDAYDEVHLHDGSAAYLVVGDQIKLQDLLYALMLPSGDDAAIAIADTVAGNARNFVLIMNVEARRLGLYQTLYANPDGLTPQDDQGNAIPNAHYSTAYDLAQLASYAMRIPLFAHIVQQAKYDLPATADHHGYTWSTTNKLLGSYQGILGIKTGSTSEAGDCLVFAAKRNGHTLLGVVLNSTDDASRFQDTRTLLDWGFGLPVQVPQV
jgi:D-alanyl-D-alanine carboxypeptidase (penicillin-binding protein 5/6)